MKFKSENNIDKLAFIKKLDEDLTRKLYESPSQGFLLARTFRSGTVGGLETELGYLENAPGFIFANPTTVLSQNFPSRTISQTPGSDWSGQPSLLFSVQPQRNTTIANYGIASLNSFNTTEALNLMNKFAAIEKKTNTPLTLSEKMQNLQFFLKTNWTTSINSLKKQLEALENKIYPLGPDKTFYKPFNLFFHAKEEYDALLFSLENLYENLAKAHNLRNVAIDINLQPHPLATMVEKHFKRLKPRALHFDESEEGFTSDEEFSSDEGLTTDEEFTSDEESISNNKERSSSKSLNHSFKKEVETTFDHNPNELTIDRVNRLKSLLIRAVGEYKHSQLAKIPKPQQSEVLKKVDNLYEEYSNYLETGARHNELVSRLYPWEITGIEWGGDKAAKTHAVTCMIYTTKRRELLYDQFSEQGINHALFTDFIMNKLSVENPTQGFKHIKALLTLLKENHPKELQEILEEIKEQLLRPVCIYEYSATQRKLINISNLIAGNTHISASCDPIQNKDSYTTKQCKEELKAIKKKEEYTEIFMLGIENYQNKFEQNSTRPTTL